jgi:hypothetical protein
MIKATTIIPTTLAPIIVSYLLPDKEWFAKAVLGYESKNGPIYFRRGRRKEAEPFHRVGDGVLHIFAGLKGWPASIDDLDMLCAFEDKVLPDPGHMRRRRGMHSWPIGYLAVRLLAYESLPLPEQLRQLLRCEGTGRAKPVAVRVERQEYCAFGNYCTRLRLCRIHSAAPMTAATAVELDAELSDILADF